MFHIVKRVSIPQSSPRRSLANEFARLRTEGVSEADALSMLFDMVTTDGPVPVIDEREPGAPQDGKAS